MVVDLQPSFCEEFGGVVGIGARLDPVGVPLVSG